MKTGLTEISGTAAQIEKFYRRIGRDIDAIANDVLAAMGLREMPILFRVNLLETAADVRGKCQDNLPLNAPAFCSKSQKTIYISAPDATARIVGHEMAHHVLNTYFSDPVPTVLHELIAQTVERKLNYSNCWWR